MRVCPGAARLVACGVRGLCGGGGGGGGGDYSEVVETCWVVKWAHTHTQELVRGRAGEECPRGLGSKGVRW